jgi:hypothetical protein
LFCRISRSTRRNEVRVPAWRSRAQTLRCPSPWNGLAASTSRIAVVSASSDIAPSGPRRCDIGSTGRRARVLLRQTLALAPPRPAAPPPGLFDHPWLTSRAKIVCLRGVPINRAAGSCS